MKHFKASSFPLRNGSKCANEGCIKCVCVLSILLA